MKDDLSGLAEEPRKPVLAASRYGPAPSCRILFVPAHCSDTRPRGGLPLQRGTASITSLPPTATRAATAAWRRSPTTSTAPMTSVTRRFPCGGGTDYFQDQEGNWWCAFFGKTTRRHSAKSLRSYASISRRTAAPGSPTSKPCLHLCRSGAPTRWRHDAGEVGRAKTVARALHRLEFIRQDAPVAAPTEVWTTVSFAAHLECARRRQDGPTPGTGSTPRRTRQRLFPRHRLVSARSLSEQQRPYNRCDN